MRQINIHGEWVDASLRAGMEVEVSLEEQVLRDVWFPATVVECLGNNLFLVEYRCSDESEVQRVSIDCSQIRPISPLRRTCFSLLEKVDAFYDFGWWSGVVTKELADDRYAVFFKHTNTVKEFSYQELRLHLDWNDSMWALPRKVPDSNIVVRDELKETATLNVINPLGDTPTIDKQTCSVTRSMKRSMATNPGSNDKLIAPCKKLKSNRVEVRNQSVDEPADKTKTLLRGKKGKLSADSSGPKALPKAAGELALITTPNTVKGTCVIKNVPSPVVIGLQCKAMTASENKKSKQLISISPENVGEAETLQSSVPLASKTNDDQDKETGDGTSTKKKWGKTFRRQPTNRKTSLALNNQNRDANAKKLPNRRTTKLTLQKEKCNTPVKGRRMTGSSIESSPQDLEDSSAQIENGNSAIVEKSLDSVSENQPLSSVVPASLAEPFQQITAIITNNNDQKPNFEKRSSFWETSKSMEAFRLLPQNPHFRPLDTLHESARERHAIYKMVDFSGVFEDISRLLLDHPRTDYRVHLDTLLELETHGFDVDPLRNRLMKMLSWKNKWAALETGSKEPEDNLQIERVKVQERNTDIMLIDTQINELRDKREWLVKQNEESTSKIVAWEEQVDEIEEAKRECDRKFCELATAPF